MSPFLKSMLISEFIRQLLEAQTKHGNIAIQIEYDGTWHSPQIKGVETTITTYDEHSFTPILHSTPPRLIIW